MQLSLCSGRSSTKKSRSAVLQVGNGITLTRPRLQPPIFRGSMVISSTPSVTSGCSRTMPTQKGVDGTMTICTFTLDCAFGAQTEVVMSFIMTQGLMGGGLVTQGWSSPSPSPSLITQGLLGPGLLLQGFVGAQNVYALTPSGGSIDGGMATPQALHAGSASGGLEIGASGWGFSRARNWAAAGLSLSTSTGPRPGHRSLASVVWGSEVPRDGKPC